MKYLILIAALFLVSCSDSSAPQAKAKLRTFMVFGNAYQIRCENVVWQKCGVDLYNCEDKQEYNCMTNLVEIK